MVSSFYACSLDERSFGFYFIFRKKYTPPTTTIIFKQLKIMIVREYKKVNRINIRKKGKNYISFLILKGFKGSKGLLGGTRRPYAVQGNPYHHVYVRFY